jgi:hypothetical protein
LTNQKIFYDGEEPWKDISRSQHVWKEMINENMIPVCSTWGKHKIHKMEKGAPHGRIGYWMNVLSGTETGTKPGVGAGGSQKAGIGLKPEIKLTTAF